MKAKPILLLVVALGCGLVAMLGVQQVMSSPAESEEAPADEVQVLVATQDIGPFAMLDESNTELVTVPRSSVQNLEGHVTSREETIDMVLKPGAAKGEHIFRSKLVGKNYAPSIEIPKGFRVVTVKVNQTKAHSGLMRPGDHVDVVLTYKQYKPGRHSVQRTVTVLQNVKVFATGSIRASTVKEDDGTERNVKNASLLVKPEDANLLMAAETRGQLTLSLRKKDDEENTVVAPITDEAFEARFGGGYTKTKSAKKQPEPGKQQSDFQRYLAGQSQNGQKTTDNGEDNQKSGEVVMIRPKWKMTIYEGTNARTEEVNDPNAPLVRVRKPKTEKKEETGQGSTEQPAPKLKEVG